jgi:hypothetical protein
MTPKSAAELLPDLRDLFSRHPEMIGLEAYHLAWCLYALNYTNQLEDEAEIAAAFQVAQTDRTGEAA